LKIRSRKFDGRCAKHKRYNPAIEGPGAIKGGCPRCSLLLEIWETSLRLNHLIRRFDPNRDDLRPGPKDAPVPFEPDPRQMPLIVD
jgi:hypothetical protein